ncbi:cell division protein ZapA [Bacillus andreraoultii]|uniref:cell division protein ZapA n=1 Tax=Bacillus andreraoultii TaxID=1499685 RepID=UPI0005396E16|nr:cell division protein ZapA [Bacillus andreraoultii]
MSDVRKNRIPVEIYGQQYMIVGTEPAEHIRTVAQLVDQKMREIKGKNATLDTSQLAVLTAVNAVNEYVKMKEQLEELKRNLNQ